jgi:heme oxygenase (biliverdin-IX-beta and delta-forming)
MNEAVPTIAPPSILSRLRSETRGEHNLVEQALDLMSPSLSINDYRFRLEKFYGFYAPLEMALLMQLDKSNPFSIQPFATIQDEKSVRNRLQKAASLKRDLAQFNRSEGELPICRQLPSLDTQAQMLGCLYVVEGATLGGRLITKHIQNTLGIHPTTGGSFFHGYGQDTAMMWQGMRQLLINGAHNRNAENNIIANAIATFVSLRRWYQSDE